MIDMVICVPANAEGTTTGAATAMCQFVNVTTGAYTNCQPFAPAGTALVGNCAEWIVEGWETEGTPLADYGEIFFSGCEAFTTAASGGSLVYGGTGDYVNMSPAGPVISQGILITPSIIQCLYTGPTP